MLSVASANCCQCGGRLRVCGHRFRRILAFDGPVEIVCKPAHCPAADCPAHPRTLSPLAEAQLNLPRWILGRDVFCRPGHRRFARHWSVPQLRAELRGGYDTALSEDALADYLRRYQTMVAARHRDAALAAEACRDVPDLVLTIDGLQPEKGHEAPYVVRELRAQRVWFAEALLASGAEGVRRLAAKAKQRAEQLGKPVASWASDKRGAFLKAVAAEFEGVPRRYSQDHFLRDVADPVSEADSHAQVKMRSKVRGLRAVERPAPAETRTGAAPAPAPPAETAEGPATETAEVPAAAAVVPDHCAAVRGTLNDDQGGPLHPPGLRVAEALTEVRASLQRNPGAKKRARGETTEATGRPHRPGPAGRGGGAGTGPRARGRRPGDRRDFGPRPRWWRAAAAALRAGPTTPGGRRDRARVRRAVVTAAFAGGPFVGEDVADVPQDNSDLERWFRSPRGHERRIHGRRHAGVRIVRQGAALAPARDAHRGHPEPFAASDLSPYRHAKPLADGQAALQRRKVMRKARPPKKRPLLLADLENRYLHAP